MGNCVMASLIKSGKRALVFGMLALACTHGHAADTRPIRLIVPTPPGSASDALARALSVPWRNASGRAVVVENVVGAGTTIGTRHIATAPSDGLTLGIISSNHTINPWLYKNIPYDAIADFTPIAMVGSVPAILVANTSVAADSPESLVKLMKSAATPLAEGVVSGTAYHLASEVFKEQAGASSNPIPYKGSAQIINDLLGGTIDFAFVAAQSAAPQIAAGKLKGLAVTTASRASALPNIPTLRESGFPKYDVDVWLAIAGPSGISDLEISARGKELGLVLADPETRKLLDRQGIQPIDMLQKDIRPFMKRDLERNRALVQRMGLSAN